MRRIAPILLLACSLFGVNFVGFVDAQTRDTPGESAPNNTASPACSRVTDNRTIRTLSDVLSCIAPYADGPAQTINYHFATEALIRFIDRIDRIDYCSISSPFPGGELSYFISRIHQINEAVNTALSTPKDSDYWVLDRNDPFPILLPYKNRIIS